MNVKLRANVRARAAIATGLLRRQPCELCGDKNVHAHHEDHKKPLEVRWLCPMHHKWADADRNERLGIVRKRRRRVLPNWSHKRLLCQVTRKRIGFSQTELACFADLQPADISRIECGGKLSDIKAKRLAKALGLKADELTQDAEQGRV